MILYLPSFAPKYSIKTQLRPSDTAMKPTGKFEIFCDVVIIEITMMKNSKAVVRMVFCARRMITSKGYFFQSLTSVNMQAARS